MKDLKWEIAVIGRFDVNFPDGPTEFLDLKSPVTVEVAVAFAWGLPKPGKPPFAQPSDRFRINKLATNNVLLELAPAVG